MAYNPPKSMWPLQPSIACTLDHYSLNEAVFDPSRLGMREGSTQNLNQDRKADFGLWRFAISCGLLYRASSKAYFQLQQSEKPRFGFRTNNRWTLYDDPQYLGSHPSVDVVEGGEGSSLYLYHDCQTSIFNAHLSR